MVGGAAPPGLPSTGRRSRIAVVTADVLTQKMAGPAIRAWHIAHGLSTEHEVELVTTSARPCQVSCSQFAVRSVTGRELRRVAAWADVIVVQGFSMVDHPFLASTKKVLVVDLYDPLHLEGLELGRHQGDEARLRMVRQSTVVLNHQLRRGDFFMCATTRQRDFWLGQMAALGRLNPRTYDEDATLHSLIAVVPFGLEEREPQHTRAVLKGVVPGIGADDEVILWGGGIYNWFDPLTLVRAVDALRRRRPRVRLFFMGVRHPNPDVPEMHMAGAARRLAEDLGLDRTHVFFNEDWVDYEDRENYLLEADVGVSTHLSHLETVYSFRTRVLDYIWAALPIVATEGDALAELVASSGLGYTVPVGDVAALEAALFRTLDGDGAGNEFRQNLAAVRHRFVWSKVLQPLIEFCRRPRRAPDLVDRGMTAALAGLLRTNPPPVGLGQRAAKVARSGLTGARSRLRPRPSE